MDTNGNGKVKVTSLAQLAPRTSDYTITNNATGDEMTVTLRDLLPSDIAELESRRKRVKPKERGFTNQKDVYGKPIPIYDEEDPAYIKALIESGNDFVYEWLLLSWAVEYPADADTPEKKLAILKDPTQGLPTWAFDELASRIREIRGIKQSDVALEKKRLKQVQSSEAS